MFGLVNLRRSGSAQEICNHVMPVVSGRPLFGDFSLLKDNPRRHSERTRTVDLLHKYGHDYKAIFVGDANMSPYEILQPGGSVEYFNEEPGAVWVTRVTDVYPKCVWLNHEPEEIWALDPCIVEASKQTVLSDPACAEGTQVPVGPEPKGQGLTVREP